NAHRMIDPLNFVLPVLLLFSGIEITVVKSDDVHTTVTNYEKYTQLNLNEEHSLQLLQKWSEQALAGLMGAIATLKLEEVHEDDKDEHAQCAQNASNVIEHAKCTVQLIDKEKVIVSPKNVTKKRKGERKRSSSTASTTISSRESPLNIRQMWTDEEEEETQINGAEKNMVAPSDVSWVGSFGMRAKRSLDLSAFLVSIPKEKKKGSHKRRKGSNKKRKASHKRRKRPSPSTSLLPVKVRKMASYELRDARRDSPFAQLAKSIKKSVLEAKHKDPQLSKDWITVIKEIKE
ncbi:hypothetical protein PMAYCL1PPCAC_15313, partial [Pristionchus mayeri]